MRKYIVSISQSKKIKIIEFLKNTKTQKIFFSFCMILIIGVTISTVYGLGEPTLVKKINTAFKKIKGYLVDLSTPIAAVAIASGVLMRKLSFGDEEKMTKGKKVIVNAIVGYAIIISVDLIIKFVEAII